ncbi:MAG: hypothetical protein KatS3mg087_1016 [Patescibacteria group bacterium]|nr:MAG: hypothetical protein KatS3mg087_1016 [Patescibacteria group bacterium]
MFKKKRSVDIWEKCDAVREAYIWVAENFYLVAKQTPVGYEFNWQNASSPPPNAIALAVMNILATDNQARKIFFLRTINGLYSKKFTLAKDLATAFGLNPRQLMVMLSGANESKIEELKRLVEKKEEERKEEEVTLGDIIDG